MRKNRRYQGWAWAPPPVNLERVGLIDRWWEHDTVQAAVEGYRARIMAEVKSLVSEGGGLLEFKANDLSYNFTELGEWETLFVLGE